MITNEIIEKLRVDAGEHGDMEQVAICDMALDGDPDAITACQRVIDNARAMLDLA